MIHCYDRSTMLHGGHNRRDAPRDMIKWKVTEHIVAGLHMECFSNVTSLQEHAVTMHGAFGNTRRPGSVDDNDGVFDVELRSSSVCW